MASFLSNLQKAAQTAAANLKTYYNYQVLPTVQQFTSPRLAQQATPTTIGGASGMGGGGAGGAVGGSSTTSLSAQADSGLKDTIANIIIDLETQLDQIPGIVLTEEEKNNFLQQAISEIAPYYDKKRAEIEDSINKGKIQSAEDVLVAIRDVSEKVADTLKKYDIEQAQTEEEFVNTLADITATEGENLDTLRYNWKERIKGVKQGQVEKGTLTSGIGQKEIADLLARQGTEETTLARRAETARTTTQTAYKYNLQNIAAAREAIQKEKARYLGTPEQQAATTQAALGRAGISSLAELPSEAEIARRRGEEPFTLYRPESLTELEEERKRATESRKLALQQEELDIRAVRYNAEKQRAALQNLMNSYS